MKLPKCCAIVALLIAPTAGATGFALAEDRIEVGHLRCFVDSGTGYVVGSVKDISCTFTPAEEAREPDPYFGIISKLGLDIGFTDESVIEWLVIAPTNALYDRGALSGDYVGASASASFAVGLGANVLVGGSDQTFALQPISVQTGTGINFAAGVAEMQLRSIE